MGKCCFARKVTRIYCTPNKVLARCNTAALYAAGLILICILKSGGGTAIETANTPRTSGEPAQRARKTYLCICRK